MPEVAKERKEPKKVVRYVRFGMAMTPTEFKLLTKTAKKHRLSKTETLIRLLKGKKLDDN